MPYGLIQLTAPAAEPVTLADAKAHLRVTDSVEDAIVSRLIVAARQAAEAATSRAFVTQSFRLTRDRFPKAARAVFLPRPPLRSIAAIRLYDAAGDATLWDSACYRVETFHTPGRLVLADSAVWPLPGRAQSGIEIDFEAGYGAAADVPAPIRQAILMLLAHYFENREQMALSQSFALPGADALLAPYRVRLL